LLGPFGGYVGVYFLKILIALFSFSLLTKEVIGRQKFSEKKNLIWMIAFIYGLLPGYPTAYFANASLPLITYLLIKLYRNPKKIRYYILVFIYPVVSNLALYGLFICGYLLFFIVYDVIKNKSLKLLPALGILILGYIVVDYRLFYAMFVENTPTIKNATDNAPNLNFIKSTIYTFCVGQYHAESGHILVILPIAGIYFVWHNIKNLKEKKSIITLPNLLVAILIFNSVVFSLYYNETFRHLYQKIFVPFKDVNYSRTVFFSPFFWYFLFIYIVATTDFKKRFITPIFIVIQMLIILLYPFRCNDINLTLSKYANIGPVENGTDWYTFKEFYSEDLFSEIKDDIGYDGEKAIAFRFQPSVLSYNNISTLDGYLSYYPLEYRKEFGEMILPQLEKSKENYDYFMQWGGRAYAYSNELSVSEMNSYDIDNMTSDGEEPLYIDIDKLKELGGVYIFSNGKISNADEEGFELLGKYNNESSLYTIYVYKVG
jgi:hypothetical protein